MKIVQQRAKRIRDLRPGKWFILNGQVGQAVSVEPSATGKTVTLTHDNWCMGESRRLTWPGIRSGTFVDILELAR